MPISSTVVCDGCDWNSFQISERSYPATISDLKREALSRNWVVTNDEPSRYLCKDCKPRAIQA